jgi:glucose/arabinose dehydrogenase
MLFPLRPLPVLLGLLPLAAWGATSTEPASLSLPPGFTAEVLVDDVPNARSMTWGAGGTLFVGTRRAGKVYAVRRALSGDPSVSVVAEKLKMPNGVAFRDDALYVAENRRVLRFPGIEDRLENPPEPELVGEELPFKNALHSWKYLDFGPDGRLYLPLGAPCNVCDEDGFARIISMEADGSDQRVEARGVRNSVGFDWHPQTGELWFSDNGRDMLGDETPPCELNRLSERGEHFGFPFCHGVDVADPKFGSQGSCADVTAPVQPMAPHSAPLAVRFYTGDMFPPEYRGQLLVAEHGSWNRSEEAGKTGYRVSLVRLKGNDAIAYEPFIEGFLAGDEVLGRPVDLLLAPDGSLLVSDDQRGVIYRVSYSAPGA